MNFFRTAVGLCAGFKSYREIRDLPVTTSIKYLLQLLAVLALVFVTSSIPATLAGTGRFMERFDRHRPEFSIQNGQIVTRAKQPYAWGNHELLFILDTTGAVTNADPRAETGLLFNASSYTYWVKGGDHLKPTVLTHTVPLRGHPDGRIDGEFIRHWVNVFLCLWIPFAWVVLILLGMLTCMLQAYFFAAVTAAMERGVGAPLQLPQLQIGRAHV